MYQPTNPPTYQSTNPDHIRWLRRLATLAENPISTRLQELDRITQKLTHLDGATCTGRVHWRDKDHPDRKPKMYVIHSIDDPCPHTSSAPSGPRASRWPGPANRPRQE